MKEIQIHKIENPIIIDSLNNMYIGKPINIMKNCINCGIQLSCGCQRRTASNGQLCCDQCVASYEASIAPPPPKPIPVPEVKVKKTDTDGKS